MPFLGSRQFDEGSPGTGPALKLRPWRSVLNDKDHGWGPVLWVLYLGFFFVQPVVEHVSLRRWLFDGLGAVIFLVLYWGVFLLERPRVLLHVGGMVLLGIVFLPFNGGGCTFFIFAASMVPFMVPTQKQGVIGIAIVASIGAVEGLLLRVDPDQTDALLDEPYAESFVMRGRAMDGWLRVGAEGVVEDEPLERWVRRGIDYARSLPPK